MLAVVSLAVTMLMVTALINYFFPIIAWIRAAWGLLGLILFVLGLVGGLIAFAVYLFAGKRAAPHLEGGATIDQLDTRQS